MLFCKKGRSHITKHEQCCNRCTFLEWISPLIWSVSWCVLLLLLQVKRLKGSNNNSNSLSVAVKGCAGADPSTQCRSEALSPSSVLQVDHDSYSDSPSSENIIQLPSKNFQNNSSAGPLKEESRRTTSSDSNVSSDVVEGDSPRTSDSCSLSTRMQHHPDQQEQWTHCNPQFPSDNSFNVGVDELSQQLAFQRGAAVKLEDGIGYNADQPFLMSRLDVDQSAFPWWDWPWASASSSSSSSSTLYHMILYYEIGNNNLEYLYAVDRLMICTSTRSRILGVNLVVV